VASDIIGRRAKSSGFRVPGRRREIFRGFRGVYAFEVALMAAAPRPIVKPRPVYLNLFAIRQPLPAISSILHRISGALLFLIGIPVLLWFVQRSLASQEAFASAMAPLTTPFGKLVLLVLAWSYLYHLLAGLRHLALDLHIGIKLAPARSSAALVIVLSVLLTIVLAVRLW
jgi:succinate dehydrogenase cytochrome b subunit